MSNNINNSNIQEWSKITDADIKAWLVAIHAMQTTGDCEGVWLGNIDDAIAIRMERMDLIEIETVIEWGHNSEIIGSEPHYVLTPVGTEIAKALIAG